MAGDDMDISAGVPSPLLLQVGRSGEVAWVEDRRQSAARLALARVTKSVASREAADRSVEAGSTPGCGGRSADGFFQQSIVDDALKVVLDDQIRDLERRIESAIAQEESSAEKSRLLRSIPGIGPVSAAILIAEMPELGRMTAGEAAAMTGLAPVPHDSGQGVAEEQSSEGGGRCDRCCSRLRSPPPLTIRC